MRHRSALCATMCRATIQIVLVTLLIAYLAVLVVCSVYFFRDPLLWWRGLQQVLVHQQRGHAAYFWGDYSIHGWTAYFPVALATKTQLATLLLSIGSLLVFWKGKPLGGDGLAFLIVPLWLFVSALLLAQINIGVRHALHLYPLVHVLAARVATIPARPGWMSWTATALLLGLSTFSALRVAPYPIAYFNELAGGPEGGRHILSDSNLDWGQGLRALARYVTDQKLDSIYLSYFGNAPPEYYGIRYQYVPAFGPLESPKPRRIKDARQLLAISDMNLKGVWFRDHDRYHWLTDRVPIAILAQSIYVYDITDDADAHFQLAKVYQAEGLDESVVAWELQEVFEIEPNHPGALDLRASIAQD